MKGPNNTEEAITDCKSARSQARDCVRALRVMCDPVLGLVDTVNTKMSAAERLMDGGELEFAQRLFVDVLRDIDRFKLGTL